MSDERALRFELGAFGATIATDSRTGCFSKYR